MVCEKSGKSFELEDATLARSSSAVSSLARHSWRPRSWLFA